MIELLPARRMIQQGKIRDRMQTMERIGTLITVGAMVQVEAMVPTMGRIMARDEPVFYKKVCS